MKKIGIITNRSKDPELIFTNKLIEWMLSHECSPELLPETDDPVVSDGQFDFLICLGGDGTLLKAAGNAAVHGVPLIGINLGNMGYLTDCTKSEALTALEKVLRNEYKLEKRMMINADLSDYGMSDTNPALNEICITKGVHSKMIYLKIWINDEYIDSCRCDGIIVSTPTGSTAYNLSAGGPILKPDGNMIAVTPICSHALYTRPFVISADDSIAIQINDINASDIILLTDGKRVRDLKNEDIIKVTRSKYFTTIIKTNNLGFYDILRQKMLLPNI